MTPVGGAASRPSDGVTSQEVAPLSAERRRELEHYLHLKRSEVISPAFCSLGFADFFFFFSQGWIQDGSGGWTKDANVEFDSDEDEPPALSPAAANETES